LDEKAGTEPAFFDFPRHYEPETKQVFLISVIASEAKQSSNDIIKTGLLWNSVPRNDGKLIGRDEAEGTLAWLHPMGIPAEHTPYGLST
jgi:hypothetical protein